MLRWVKRYTACLALPLLMWSGGAIAADFDGSQLSVIWGVPFAGILLSIALMPLLVPHFWHHHFGCLLYTSPSPRDRQKSRMPSSA